VNRRTRANQNTPAANKKRCSRALQRQLAKGDKALIGNTGYRRYLKTISQEHFVIDQDRSGQGRGRREVRRHVGAAH
jgi:hypothetical protein